MDQLIEINVEDIELLRDENGRPLNPRGMVTDTTALQASIREVGLIEPLQVVHDPQTDKWALLSGHRRLTAIKALGWDTVTVIEKEMELRLDVILDAMLTGAARQDYPAITLNGDGEVNGGLCYAIHSRLQRGPATVESLARTTGASPGTVSALIDLYSAPVELRRAVADGRMSLSAFAMARRMNGEFREELLEKVGEDGQVTVKEVRGAIRRIKRQKESLQPLLAPANGAAEVEGEAVKGEAVEGEAISLPPTLLGRLNALLIALETAPSGGWGVREIYVLEGIRAAVNKILTEQGE